MDQASLLSFYILLLIKDLMEERPENESGVYYSHDNLFFSPQLQGENGLHCEGNVPTCKKPCFLHNTVQIHLLPAAEDIWEETSGAKLYCCLHMWVLCVWRKQQSQHAGISGEL